MLLQSQYNFMALLKRCDNIISTSCACRDNFQVDLMCPKSIMDPANSYMLTVINKITQLFCWMCVTVQQK